jgi:hypothetical protein
MTSPLIVVPIKNPPLVRYLFTIVKTIRNDLTKETQIQLKNYDKLVYDKQ